LLLNAAFVSESNGDTNRAAAGRSVCNLVALVPWTDILRVRVSRNQSYLSIFLDCSTEILNIVIDWLRDTRYAQNINPWDHTLNNFNHTEFSALLTF